VENVQVAPPISTVGFPDARSSTSPSAATSSPNSSLAPPPNSAPAPAPTTKKVCKSTKPLSSGTDDPPPSKKKKTAVDKPSEPIVAVMITLSEIEDGSIQKRKLPELKGFCKEHKLKGYKNKTAAIALITEFLKQKQE
jgi:hypothetical protein